MTSDRDSRGRWALGNRGNPSGRPRRAVTAEVIRKQLGAARAADLIESAYALAMMGEIAALKLLMDRLYPVPRGSDTGEDDLQQVVIEIVSPENRIGGTGVDEMEDDYPPPDGTKLDS